MSGALWLFVCAFLMCGCRKKSQEGKAAPEPQPSEDIVYLSSAPTAKPSGPPPPPDAFVIQESEFAVIQEFRKRTEGRPNRIGDKDYAFTLSMFDQRRPSMLGLRYKTLDTLILDVPGDAPNGIHLPLELRAPDVQVVRGYIEKYREWTGEASKKGLPHGVSKKMGTIRDWNVEFVTPNLLKISFMELKGEDVDTLERMVTTDLLAARSLALQELSEASKIIQAEDQRRGAFKADKERDRKLVDETLR